MSAESQRQRPTDDDQQLEHVPIVAGAGARINSDEFWRGSGSRGRRPNECVDFRLLRFCSQFWPRFHPGGERSRIQVRPKLTPDVIDAIEDGYTQRRRRG